MRQCVQYLEGVLLLPDLLSLSLSTGGVVFVNRERCISPEGTSDFAISYPSSLVKGFYRSSSQSLNLSSLKVDGRSRSLN
ncbi:hypothetical protein Nepgr_031912 [Nepenthes gracilis]|uniref:Uncharacterized protein n=1 Tax=Nepenthes gracilis TaxID=150966 RepID=A0AAD3TJ05_NEPGR|nr:hypothetical protein Nepgr_031912 [Nepenthes gracilis]